VTLLRPGVDEPEPKSIVQVVGKLSACRFTSTALARSWWSPSTGPIDETLWMPVPRASCLKLVLQVFGYQLT